MWADNETRIDLLGFEFLVDELLLILRDPRLLPVTVGVAGDWGSGKSSLIGMAEEALAADEKFLTVSFSPWRFEDYEDVKTALMASVIGAVQERAQTDATFAEKAGKRLGGMVRRVNMLGAAKLLGRLALLSHGADVPPEMAALSDAQLLKPAQVEEEDETEAPDRLHSIAEFRTEFEALMADLDDLQALVVFIDDLDRCLPDSIVDTFEAIRLFLHVPKTAYVIAADQRIVQAAIEARYPANREGDETLGVDYLEKIIQISVNIPPLSEPEAETYINLLLAELYLDAGPLERLQAAAQERRKSEQLTVVMNWGIAREILDSPPDGLEAAFALANQISPVLARGLRGNPRQLKRFLNILSVRRRAAGGRGIELDPAVLSKLMILEQLHLKDFAQLFAWQIDQQGKPVELKLAESLAATDKKPKGMSDEAATWAAQPHIGPWLRLEPALADVDLAPYFYFSRDRLSPAAPAARLPAALQELLGRLEHAVAATRRTAIEEGVDLGAAEMVQVFDVLLERGSRDPRGHAVDSAIEIAARKSELVGRLASALDELPPASVPLQLPAKLVAAIDPHPPELTQLLERWRTSGSGGLKRAAAEALGAAADGYLDRLWRRPRRRVDAVQARGDELCQARRPQPRRAGGRPPRRHPRRCRRRDPVGASRDRRSGQLRRPPRRHRP
ncbi:MAG: KAP family NTPase [Gaiellaceae bacterium MAG52_C11]|nr:KAP family NTPase [Candidatus Gaiellasilicea maunaloa]